ncbi:MAG: hypothetical protein LBR09_03115 [Endomicrobium sp.]|nr:hypothetical protein [Endomicrobium sp.]
MEEKQEKIIIALISFQLIGCAPTPNIIIDPPELEQPKTKIITIGMGVLIGIIVISSCIINWIKAKDAEIAELKELNQKHDNELKEQET